MTQDEAQRGRWTFYEAVKEESFRLLSFLALLELVAFIGLLLQTRETQ
jgi:hypothetical protein